MTVVAIDFGTSNTVVCLRDPVTDRPQILHFDGLSRTFDGSLGATSVIPSLLYVGEGREVAIGEDVRSRRLGFAQPERLFRAFKRELVADVRPPSRTLDGEVYDAEVVSELFLRHIWQHVQALHVTPTRIVFTVPVGAFEAYLTWFRDLAADLDLPDMQVVDESTAAAIGYAVQQPGAIVLTVDFGGGTLDLSLVRVAAPNSIRKVMKAEVLAKADAYLGGTDIDVWIAEHFLAQLNQSRSQIGEVGWLYLLELAERIKIRLSQEPEARESWFDDENFMSYDLHLSREEFAELLEARQLLEQLRQSLDEVLAIAMGRGIAKSAIEQVLLVGGSCQIPAVQQLLVSYFGRQRVKLDQPFEAVARGAVLLGQSVVVDDYLRHGYAIRLWEPYEKRYSYYPIFERGTRYPCQKSDPVTLQVATEGQREIRLDIGEIGDISRPEVIYDAKGRMTSTHLQNQSAFRSLLDPRHVKAVADTQVCIAHLNPPGQTGMDRVDVLFEVDDRRILLATVKDLLTQKILIDRQAIARLD